jgi:hypothetical protein
VTADIKLNGDEVNIIFNAETDKTGHQILKRNAHLLNGADWTRTDGVTPRVNIIGV